MRTGLNIVENNSVVVGFVARNRIQPKITAIQEEYSSNARLLSYFAQNNPQDMQDDGLFLLETALLRRQEMLVEQMADLPAKSLDDLRAKLEIWAEESDESSEDDVMSASTRIVYSVLKDIRRLCA